jgi:hypothetical protein
MRHEENKREKKVREEKEWGQARNGRREEERFPQHNLTLAAVM